MLALPELESGAGQSGVTCPAGARSSARRALATPYGRVTAVPSLPSALSLLAPAPFHLEKSYILYSFLEHLSICYIAYCPIRMDFCSNKLKIFHLPQFIFEPYLKQPYEAGTDYLAYFLHNEDEAL